MGDLLAGEATYRLLGALEVRTRGEQWQGITRAKWRGLLAVLLINSNRVVSSDELQRQLWPDVSRSAARKLVQQYVSQLRRTLADPDGAVIRTRPSGYELRAEPGQCDTDRFLATAAAGRQALADGDPVAAVHLSGALAMWRGAAFADVTNVPAVSAEAARLNECRMITTEAWIRAELAIGNVETVVPEAAALVASHPVRERLSELLMIALYLSGRQADALGVFHRLRRVLREEMGLDPGHAAQNLARTILRGQPVDARRLTAASYPIVS